MGLLLGLKCVLPVGEVQAACVAEGLMAITAGDNVLRLAPPLVVTDADLDEAVAMLRRASLRVLPPSPRRRRSERLAQARRSGDEGRSTEKGAGPRHFLDLRDFDAVDVAADAGRRRPTTSAAACRPGRWPARRWR